MWTERQTARVIELWDGKYSASNIQKIMNEEFGLALTRNAVIGKVHRLQRPKRKPTYRKPASGGRRKWATKEIVWILDANRPEPINIPLVETSKFHCRYINGDDDLCCGHKTVNDSSWCAYHYQIVYSRPKLNLVKEAA